MRIAFVLMWICIVALFSKWNWYISDELKREVRHDRQLIYRLLIGAFLSVWSFHYYREAFDVFTFIGFQSFTFLLEFSILLNLMRHKGIFYISPKSNRFDKILKWIFDRTVPVFFYWVIFIIALSFALIYIGGRETFLNMWNGIYDY